MQFNHPTSTIDPALLGTTPSDSFLSSPSAAQLFKGLASEHASTNLASSVSPNLTLINDMDGIGNPAQDSAPRAGPIPINRSAHLAPNFSAISNSNPSAIANSFGTDMDQEFSPVSSYSNQHFSLNNASALASRFGQQQSLQHHHHNQQQQQLQPPQQQHQFAGIAFSQSPPTSPGFQSMSLPNNSDWVYTLNSPPPSSNIAGQFGLADMSSAGGIPPYSPQTDVIMQFNPDDPNFSAKQAQLMLEKRRRRRESHNAVERRRRDNINEKIQELHSMLPTSMLDPNTKPNKGSILRMSVDYIRQLRAKIDEQTLRIQELETRAAHGVSSDSLGIIGGSGGANGGGSSGMSVQSEQQGGNTTSGLASMFASVNADQHHHHHHHHHQ